jgi:hypothetical protein
MANFEEYLSNQIKLAIHKNDEELREDSKNKNKKLRSKIENFRMNKMTNEEREEYSVEDIMKKINEVSLLRCLFRKDPCKQSIHENSQIQWIKMNKYEDIEKLPSNLHGVYLEKSELKKRTTTNRVKNGTKTFDAYIPSRKIYVVLKYSTTEGGAQDNQYRDVENFITQINGYFQENKNSDYTFEFYLDGKYYTRNKLEHLETLCNKYSDKISILSASSILRVMNQEKE